MASFDNLFDVAGPADAPPILFLHVVGSTRKWFLPQSHALSEEYRVLAMDLPGHGVLADARFTFEAAMPVIENVIRAATDERVLLAGVSLGAYTAIAFAARHPERVAGLVLSGVGINFIGGWGALSRGFATFLRLTRPVSRPIVTASARRILRPLPRSYIQEIDAAGYYFDSWPQCFYELTRYDFRALLGAYAGPTLLINGVNDFQHPFERALAAGAPNIQLQPIADASHWPNIEQPEAYHRAIRQFARTIGWQSTHPGLR